MAWREIDTGWIEGWDDIEGDSGLGCEQEPGG